MKKSKIYVIVPLILLGIFYAYYWNFRSDYDAKQEAKAAAEKQVKIDKLKAEAEAREAAIHDAVEAQKVRKAERLAREEKERKQKDDRENARLESEKADQESQKLSRQAEKLTKDVDAAEKEIATIQAEEKRSEEEIVFLKQYTDEANANREKLAEVMTKIEAADQAIAKAALEAAKAAAKKNNS
jgi:hypothetical protein